MRWPNDFRERRLALGLRQDDVAEHLNLNRTQVARFEAGKQDMTGENLLRLARLYRFTIVDDLAIAHRKRGGSS